MRHDMLVSLKNSLLVGRRKRLLGFLRETSGQNIGTDVWVVRVHVAGDNGPLPLCNLLGERLLALCVSNILRVGRAAWDECLPSFRGAHKAGGKVFCLLSDVELTHALIERSVRVGLRDGVLFLDLGELFTLQL